MSFNRIKFIPRGKDNFYVDTDWNDSKEVGYTIVQYLIYLPVIFVFGYVVPFITLAFALIATLNPENQESEIRKAGIFGVIMSIIICLDGVFGGPLWYVLHNSLDWVSYLVAFQIFLGIGNLFMLFLNYFQVNIPVLVFYGLLIAFGYFFFESGLVPFSASILSDTPIWFLEEVYATTSHEQIR